MKIQFNRDLTLTTKPDLPNEKRIMFAILNHGDKNKIISIPTTTLALRINQNFTWTETVIVEKDESLSFYLLKSSLPSTENFDECYIKNLMEIWFENKLSGKVIVLCCDALFLGELLCDRDILKFSPIIQTKNNESIWKPLLAQFEKMEPDIYQPVKANALPVVTELLGFFDLALPLNNRNDIHNLQKMLNQIKEVHQKLAIAKINNLVGYGVIACEDIPANTAITFYAGTLMDSLKKDIDDNYAICGGGKLTISAKKHRNFAGFITHAFEKNPSSADHNEIYLDDFMPWDKDAINWHGNLLSANVFSHPFIVNYIPYIIFKNKEIIPKNSILAWDYGFGYWKSRKIAPALLTLKGEIVKPTSFTCTKKAYNQAFTTLKPMAEEKDLSHPASFGFFNLSSSQSIGNDDSRECGLDGNSVSSALTRQSLFENL